MIASLHRPLQLLGFAAALLVSAVMDEGISPAVVEAIIWLPTGVAIAGLWLLGLRAAWVVAGATFAQRLLLGYDPSVVLSATFGSTGEAVLGVLVLRHLGLRGDFARLRDVLALFAAAAVAPIASILASWIGRHLVGELREAPFYAGSDGWWRMNALGALTVVPLVLTWVSRPAVPLRGNWLLEGAGLQVVTLGSLWLVMTQWSPGPVAIILLYLVLPVALLAALRFGQRGAVTTAATAAMFVATFGARGIGPFLSVPVDERHVAIQVFGLTLVGVPLVIGSLIAERESNASRWLQSEGLRQALLRLLPDVSYRFRVDGTILDVFVPDGVLPPLARGALVGRKLADLAAPDPAGRLQAAIEQAHGGARPDPVDFRLDAGDAERMHEARFVRLADGEVLGVVRDITDRKRFERLLAWQAEILELIAAGRPNTEVFRSLVQGLESFLEGGTGSLLMLEGSRLHVACAPGLPDAYNDGIEGFEIGPDRGSCGTAAYANRTVVAADLATDPRWATARDLALAHGLRACWSVPVRSPDGAVFGTFAIYHRTVRSPVAAEILFVERAALLAGIAIDRERREDLLTSINRNVSEGLYRSVPGQGLVYANDAFARLFGHGSPRDLRMAVANQAFDVPQHGIDLARLLTAQETHGPEESLFHRRDGSIFWGLLSRTAVRGPDGAVVACDGALTDITAQKQLEERLRQAQKMEAVGKLAGGVAHDFNNLLTAISGYAEAVREQLPAGSEPRNDVDEILRASERAANLTRQLLAFSRQQVLLPQVLDLAGIVDDLGSMLRRLIGEHIRLVTHFAPGPACVRVDRGQLQQVMLNLVVNARDAMPGGGTLTITTESVDVDEALASRHVDLTVGPHVALSVRDTGTGMTREVQLRAFDPFFTTKAPGQGTGLGLSTVYGIVKQSGGAVWIDSAPGVGTTVWIHLPRVAAVPAPEKVVPAARPSPRPATVLVAEDEQLVRDLVQRILVRAGYEVLAAGHGAAALALVERHAGPIDLLLTDVVMPHMGGRELASRLRAAWPQLPVVFMSGYASDGEHLVAELAGAVDFLQKPFIASRLLELVGGLLERGPGPVSPAPRSAEGM